MVLELSKSFVHNQQAAQNQNRSDEELKGLLMKMIEETGGDASAIKSNGNGKLELQGVPNLKLHSLMLQAEELGLSLKYTKKTLIEIC